MIISITNWNFSHEPLEKPANCNDIWKTYIHGNIELNITFKIKFNPDEKISLVDIKDAIETKMESIICIDTKTMDKLGEQIAIRINKGG